MTKTINYSWRSATDNVVVAYKRYDKNPILNQVVYVFKKGTNVAFVELNMETYINDSIIADMKDALDLAKKDKDLLKFDDFDIQ